jgi:hypothetical protein
VSIVSGVEGEFNLARREGLAQAIARADPAVQGILRAQLAASEDAARLVAMLIEQRIVEEIQRSSAG